MMGTNSPPVRACLFDMDGLLINTSDIHTVCHNLILGKFGCPPLTWDIKCQMQGRPAPEATALLLCQPQYRDIPKLNYASALADVQARHFRLTKPLPGVEKLLSDLSSTARGATENKIHVALATSSFEKNFEIKSAHLQDLFSVFTAERRVFGDDPRILPGRGKPNPDIFLLALQAINDGLEEGERPIEPTECLVLEDGMPGVAAGRNAGMRVVWVPHPGLVEQMQKEDHPVKVLGGDEDWVGREDMIRSSLLDGTVELLKSLEGFPYEKYGMQIV